MGRISPGVTSGDWPVGLHGGGCRWCVCAGPGCAVAAPGRLGGEMYICPLCAVLGGLSGLAEGSRGIREEGEAHGAPQRPRRLPGERCGRGWKPRYSVLRNSAIATVSMPRPMMATRASDSDWGTSQPAQLTPGASAWTANGLMVR